MSLEEDYAKLKREHKFYQAPWTFKNITRAQKISPKSSDYRKFYKITVDNYNQNPLKIVKMIFKKPYF